ncbi:hypothetical protein DFQ01_13653 [Paenibacillus cellulosilyticus]|uniref:ComX pheromone n=1 Tax=Paenibacillus cellulosilyticus TaxID=375489 RepID=A0A2V2YGT9_9BACL|nr:competence pheromone ComX [Paenibacillus cellulosilyticus]PWV92107.1 hypothetical protein DFQ01_13653 [Paenibacillus cellulosilyticus]QKS44216.1 competence pheromone ComX [Paenibacillus cellulosilyticus]
MLKNAIAQLKQNQEMMSQFLQGRVALAGVSAAEQRALHDIMSGQQTAKEQVRNLTWWAGT